MMLTRRAGYGILRRRKQKWIVAVKKCSIHGFLRMDENKIKAFPGRTGTMNQRKQEDNREEKYCRDVERSIIKKYRKEIWRKFTKAINEYELIQDGDKILISEGCTHHRQCNDIGTVKLPGWIRSYTGREPEFVYTSGTGFQEDLKAFRVIVHCGACMLNEREMKYRLACAKDQGVAMTNYGILIAHIHGILKRSLGPFPDIEALLED